MSDELVILDRAAMDISYTDMDRLARMCSEGQTYTGMQRVYSRFPEARFMQSPHHTHFVVVGENRYVTLVRDSIINARKMFP